MKSWKRSQTRRKYDGPDAVTIDGVKHYFPEEPEMAAKEEFPRVVVELNRQRFDSIIRKIKTAPMDRVKSIRTATFTALDRLGKKRNGKKAVKGIPAGSDQGNVRAIIEWLDKIGPKDKRAIKQLIAIDATCVARSE